MKPSVALSRVHFPVTTLGPGHRLGIWFQGCSIRCDGCISMDTWAPAPPSIPVAELLRLAMKWADTIDGVTITGGEPFDQRNALHALLLGLRQQLGRRVDILVYTGYPIESVRPWLDAHKGLLDAVVAGPFVMSESDALPLRGSDNQTLSTLTLLGRERFARLDWPRPDRPRRLDVMADADGTVWLAGIPRRHDLARLRARLADQGTSMISTEHAAVRRDVPEVGDEG